MKFRNIVQFNSLEELTALLSVLDSVSNNDMDLEYIITQEESEDFKPGTYYCWWEDSFDRVGQFKAMIFERIPDHPTTGSDIAKIIKENEKKRLTSAQKIARLQAAQIKNQECDNPPKDEDFECIEETEKLFSEAGFSRW